MKKSFWWKYISSLLFSITVFCVINFTIDPLGLNYLLLFRNVNEYKPAAVRFERKIKAYRIKKVKPKTLVLGSSRAVYGVNPETLQGFPIPVYNAALEYGQLFEMLKFLEYSIKVAPIEEVVLFLHYYNFNTSEGVKSFEIPVGKSDIISLLKLNLFSYFSLNAFLGTLETLILNTTKFVRIGSVQTGYIRLKQHGDRNFKAYSEEKRLELVRGEAQIVLESYNKGLDIVKKIKQLCLENNVKLYSILGPYPKEQILVRNEMNTWDVIEEWKHALKQIIEYVDYYNENSPFEAENFYDRVHFSAEVGQIMVNSLKVSYP